MINRFLIILIFAFSLLSPAVLLASETDGTVTTGGSAGYAWSNQAGWINFGTANGNVHITDSGITGYAWSTNYGWINMNPTNGGVSVAADGSLSGYAWGENLGWINFGSVSISSTGVFSGTASGSIIGTLTFNCTNCSVTTDYVPQNYRSATTTTTTTESSGGGVRRKTTDTTTETDSGTVPTEIDTTTFPPDSGTVPGVGTTGEEVTGGAADGDQEGAPAQLFDIRLLIDSARVERIIDLVARVTFTSFGRVPTPVDLTFTIIDASGNEVWRGEDSITVETDQVLTKRFAEIDNLPDLPDGDYVLKLHTLYNSDVEDDFEIPFSIGASPYTSWVIWLLLGALMLLLLTAAWRFFFIARRRDDEENEDISLRYKNRFNS